MYWKTQKAQDDLLILQEIIIIFRHLEMSESLCIRCKSSMQVCYHAFVFCHVMQCQSGICRCCSAVRGQCVCYPSVTGEHERICELRCDTQVSGELHTCLTCTWSPARAQHTAASHAFFTWNNPIRHQSELSDWEIHSVRLMMIVPNQFNSILKMTDKNSSNSIQTVLMNDENIWYIYFLSIF